MSKLAMVYIVKRVPITAGAKMAAGYSAVDFEYFADSAREAVGKAIEGCMWEDPTRNFSWKVSGTRVVEVESK